MFLNLPVLCTPKSPVWAWAQFPQQMISFGKPEYLQTILWSNSTLGPRIHVNTGDCRGLEERRVEGRVHVGVWPRLTTSFSYVGVSHCQDWYVQATEISPGSLKHKDLIERLLGSIASARGWRIRCGKWEQREPKKTREQGLWQSGYSRNHSRPAPPPMMLARDASKRESTNFLLSFPWESSQI